MRLICLDYTFGERERARKSARGSEKKGNGKLSGSITKLDATFQSFFFVRQRARLLQLAPCLC